MENRHKLTLDFKVRTIASINFVQNDIDTSVIEFLICDNGVPVSISGQDITITFLKPDNTVVMQDADNGVTILESGEEDTGKLECVLRSQTLAVAGIVKAEISFSEGGKKLSTAQFSFIVTPSLDNGEGIISKNEIPKLDAKIAEIEARFVSDEEAWNLQIDNKLSEADNKIIEIESRYNSDKSTWDTEVNSKLAEADLKIGQTENARQAAITATQDANTAATNAITAMNNANAAEALRVSAEQARVVAENERIQAYKDFMAVFTEQNQEWRV
jgi:hypothetical protein